MSDLLSRNADSIIWLARYMERIENLARILGVAETFARDRAGRNWLPVVQINADEERFFKRHRVADAGTVPHFYILDQDNPNSIISSMRAARENARSLRPLISTEMWRQINRMSTWMGGLSVNAVSQANLSALCTEIKEACQLHGGITEGTFYRDQAHYFYMLGKSLERADQTTRLLDIKYHTLLPRAEDVGSALDVSHWNALLRAAAGYQASRRVFAGTITPRNVAAFMLFSDSFPRSVILCVRQMDWLLTQLRTRYHLRGGARALELLDELRAALTDQTIDAVINRGLHEFIDWVQQHLMLIFGEIREAFCQSR
ncbi:alpha-E domain-containing protein [Paramagnetospirillum kuznetsovii]|uniref:Alpha-E domain-containing protein n=1 Tax=Paramagnetospirillum kuznetsovii TaxID=2053833 RepID=A0A364NSS0_9PROT|nr:alpha-E domain-containing protein [Paramagnetospirillum kuznetsovii]RAU20118.1 alpha-E domain-containing protein [Paramagnetospirillum kuznetsovii]